MKKLKSFGIIVVGIGNLIFSAFAYFLYFIILFITVSIIFTPEIKRNKVLLKELEGKEIQNDTIVKYDMDLIKTKINE